MIEREILSEGKLEVDAAGEAVSEGLLTTLAVREGNGEREGVTLRVRVAVLLRLLVPETVRDGKREGVWTAVCVPLNV